MKASKDHHYKMYANFGEIESQMRHLSPLPFAPSLLLFDFRSFGAKFVSNTNLEVSR